MDAPIEIRVFGEDLSVLKNLTQEVEATLLNTANVINVRNPLTRSKTELKFTLDKYKAGLLGISELDFDRTLRASFNGLIIDQTTLDDDEYNIVLQMPFDITPSIDDFYKIYLSNRMGSSIPLHHVAKMEFASSPASFSHYDTKRYVAVTGSLTDLDLTISRTIEIMDQLDQMTWPDGYYYVAGGEYEEQQATFGNLGVILVSSSNCNFCCPCLTV